MSEARSIRKSSTQGWVEAIREKGSNPVTHAVDLSAYPGDAVARALALAGVEALAASVPAVRERMRVRRSQATPAAAPRPTLTEPAPPLPARPAAAQETVRHSLRVGAAASWRTFMVAQGLSLWGAEADLERDFGRHWCWQADIEIAGAAKRVGSLGDASAQLLSLGGFLGTRPAAGKVSVALALGGRVGLARLAGDAAGKQDVVADHVVRPWGGPAVSARLAGEIGHFALRVGAEGGVSLLTTAGLANDENAVAVRGAWLALTLGGSYAIRR